MHDFPVNPSDGTVYEAQPGVYFAYDAPTRSWGRVVGGGKLFPPATPVRDGVMTAADLRKINRIPMPLPTATIRAEGCAGKFTSGAVGLYSTDDFLRVTGEPSLDGDAYQFRIHKNTSGFDFTLDVAGLIGELVARGQVNLIGRQGPRGDRGPRGGRGPVLSTGPKGPKGDTGESPPCDITITRDETPYVTRSTNNKVVVGVRTEAVSTSQYDVIVERAVIGNPDAAPTTAKVNCGDESNWVLALPTDGGTAQQVYYVDLTSIIAAVGDRFESELQRVKKGHEDVVKFWLDKMSALFQAQKASVCCAITNCKQQKASEERAAAGQGIMASRQFSINPLQQPDTSTNIEIIGVNSMKPDVGLLVVSGANQVSTSLPPGRYMAEIVRCCVERGGEYFGNAVIEYSGKTGREVVRFVKAGRFTSPGLARRSYTGLLVEFDHYGGTVSAVLPFDGPSQVSNGAMTIRIATVDSVESSCVVTNLNAIESAVRSGSVCSIVAGLPGQDYMVIDAASLSLSYSPGFIAPVLAWPTFDGRSLVPLGNNVTLRTSDTMRRTVLDAVAANDYTMDGNNAMCGTLEWLRNGTILFPVG